MEVQWPMQTGFQPIDLPLPVSPQELEQPLRNKVKLRVNRYGDQGIDGQAQSKFVQNSKNLPVEQQNTRYQS